MNIEHLESLGFDQCYADDDRKTIKVSCSQCEAVTINNVPCHETGCPHQKHECEECDAMIQKGHRLCESCANPEE